MNALILLASAFVVAYASLITDDLAAPPIGEAFILYTVESDADQDDVRASVAAVDSQFLRHSMKVEF